MAVPGAPRFAALLAALLLVFSAPGHAEELEYLNLPDIDVESVEEIDKSLSIFDKLMSPKGRMVQTKDIEFFRNNLVGASWSLQGGRRAMAIGRPLFCQAGSIQWPKTGPEGTEQIRTSRVLAARALESCLENAAGVEAIVGERCRCQLVAMDDYLFVAPRKLQFATVALSFHYYRALESRKVIRSPVTLNTAVFDFATGTGSFSILDSTDKEIHVLSFTALRNEDGKAEGRLTGSCAAVPCEGRFTYLHENEDDSLLLAFLDFEYGRVVLTVGGFLGALEEAQPQIVDWLAGTPEN